MSFSGDNCSALGDFSNDNLALEYCDDLQVLTFCLNSCQELVCQERNESTTPMDVFLSVASKSLSYLLLAGFAATVDTKLFFLNFRTKGVYIGLLAQFVMMPILGFLTVLAFKDVLAPSLAVMVIIVTTCPGGAYSNWFCSMFNADLALSVAMTTVSTTLAGFLMPLNILFYVSFLMANISDEYGEADIIQNLPYGELFITLGVVIAGVLSGLAFSHKFPGYKKHANFVGNVAGILLQALGLVVSGTSCAPPWEQDLIVFIASCVPLAAGLLTAIGVTSMLDLPKPQRVAISIEGAYQNAGIAVAIGVSLGSQGRAATVVPVLYGVYEAIFFFSFCFWSVWAGWTLTPKGENILVWLFSDYQDQIGTHELYEKWRKKNHIKIGNDPNDSEAGSSGPGTEKLEKLNAEGTQELEEPKENEEEVHAPYNEAVATNERETKSKGSITTL